MMKKKCKFCKKQFQINKKRNKYWWLYYKRKFCSNSCWKKHYRKILKKDQYLPINLQTEKQIQNQRTRIKNYYYRHWERNKKRLRWKDNPQRKKWELKFRLKLKILILKHYCEKGIIRCVCCGEKHIEFLTIDHIYGNGNKHRTSIKSKKGGKSSFYQWLKNNNFPKGYRVLCMNCNFAMRFNKKCPHQK